MDYEKKYNEALERAKEIKGKILQSHLSTESCKAISEYIDTIIPELNESKDEKIRKALIEALTVSNTIGELKFRLPEPTREECIAWLEKQKEQKPAEWSEDDEEMLNSCISSIEESKENRYAYKETDGDTSYDREVDWLKSLRPSWKPSEEQMEELWNVISYIERPSSNFLGVPALLESLYEQLKKL